MAWNLYGESIYEYGPSWEVIAPYDVPVTYGFMHQLCGDGTINPTTDSSNDPAFWTTNISNSRNLFSNKLFL